MTETIVVASGYFTIFHKGHVEYLQRSKSLGDKLIVIVNNDFQQMLKKGRIIVNERDRLAVVNSLACVDMAILACDKDRTVCQTLGQLPHVDIFTNGGDQTNDKIPERVICEKLNIKLVDGLGDKIESSTNLIEKAGL